VLAVCQQDRAARHSIDPVPDLADADADDMNGPVLNDLVREGHNGGHTRRGAEEEVPSGAVDTGFGSIPDQSQLTLLDQRHFTQGIGRQGCDEHRPKERIHAAKLLVPDGQGLPRWSLQELLQLGRQKFQKLVLVGHRGRRLHWVGRGHNCGFHDAKKK